MLLDLLVHLEGPRVRDRISHGEVREKTYWVWVCLKFNFYQSIPALQVDFYQISKIISNHIVCMVAVFCLQYGIGVEKEHTEQVYKSLLASERKYVSLFHPLSLLERDVSKSQFGAPLGGGMFTYAARIFFVFSQLEQLVSLLHNWMNIPMPDNFKLRNSDDQDKESDQGSTFDAAFQTFCSKCNLRLPLEDSSYGKLERLIGSVWDMPIKTLFLSRYTMEVVGVMRQTVENALTSVNQVNLTSV